jgi:hypothetical protein
LQLLTPPSGWDNRKGGFFDAAQSPLKNGDEMFTNPVISLGCPDTDGEEDFYIVRIERHRSSGNET